MHPTGGAVALGPLVPADLVRHATVGQVAIRGDRVVYTLRRVVDGVERIELWTVGHAGGAPTPLASAPGAQHHPRPSPSGRWLAFLRSQAGAPAQVCLLDLFAQDASQPRQVVAFPRGAHDLTWTPDERSLIVLAEDSQSPLVHRAAGVAPDAPPTAIRLTGIDWRSDGDDEHGQRLYPRHLHRVSLPGGDATRLTGGAWSASRPRCGADGWTYFLADTAADSDLDPAPQVHAVAPDGSGLRVATRFPGGVVRFHVAGGRLRVLAHAAAGRPDGEPPIWYELGGAGQGPAVTCRIGVDGTDRAWVGLLGDETDLHEWQLELDDAAGVSTVCRDGSTRPAEIDSGAELESGPMVCGAIAEGDDGRRVAVLAAGPGACAPDVYALDGGVARRLTRHGDWLRSRQLPAWQRREAPGPDGPITVHMVEPVAGPARGTVLALHGGPTGQWGVVPPVEAVLLAGAGFRVAMPNIRGSVDRGPRWAKSLRGAWGDADVADVMAVCDDLIAAGLARPGALGVMGLSYGGFLTQYLIGVTDRFAAAVSENGVANQVSAWAGCDVGPAFCRSADLGDPLTPQGVRRLWDTSPLRNVARVRTPLLMLQGEDDRTCPASDNEQFFIALRALRREVEYVIYPQESHLMVATGRIDRRIDRHQRVLDWFTGHIGTDAGPAADTVDAAGTVAAAGTGAATGGAR